ncbi:MAG: hypothetical protein WKF75_18075 [Singulisphaera sp.]
MAMSNALPPGYAVPNTSLPKTTGTLNIIFACLVLLFVVLQIGMTFLAPMLIQFAQISVREARAKAEASRKQQIDTLKADEAAAGTEEEKERIRGQIKAIEARPQPAGPDMNALVGQMDNPVMRAYTWTDIGTALILNALMLASGIGLLRLKERARRLAIWVGGLKIARLAGLMLIQMVFILPLTTKMQREMFAEMGASGAPNAQAMQTTAKMAAAAGMAMNLILAVLAMIWPIVMIVLLTRPGSRAACLAASTHPSVEAEGS